MLSIKANLLVWIAWHCRLDEINFVDLRDSWMVDLVGGLDREGQRRSRVTGVAVGWGSKGRKLRGVVFGG